MNLKKYIKLKESAQEVQLSEEEEMLYNSLLKRTEQNNAKKTAIKKNRHLWKIVTLIVSVLGAIAITLTCVFTMRMPDDVLYGYENIISEESTFGSMLEDIRYLDLENLGPTIDQVSMSYDLESNDKLYYSISADIDLSSLYLVIVINEKYNYEFNLKTEPLINDLNDYTIFYNRESSRGDPQINYSGWIQVQTETVYFNYVQIPALGDEAFFESIQQIIQVKQ